jgi:hypothetical protein
MVALVKDSQWKVIKLLNVASSAKLFVERMLSSGSHNTILRIFRGFAFKNICSIFLLSKSLGVLYRSSVCSESHNSFCHCLFVDSDL